jgi:flagellin
MGYTYAYTTMGDVKTAAATFSSTTSSGVYVSSVEFEDVDTDKGLTSSDINTLAKALKNQGVTITTATVSTDSGKQVGYTLSLNGSDANANYNVVTTSSVSGDFAIYTTGGVKVATINVTGNDNDIVGISESTAAYTASAAIGENDVVSLYDADGNAISANKLATYYTAFGVDDPGDVIKGVDSTDDKGIKANAGAPKVYDALGKEVSAATFADKIAATKDQTATLKLSLQVGADGTSNNRINLNIDAMSAKGLGINGLKVDGTDGTNATDAIEVISAAIKKVSTQRSALGAAQNRLEHTINNLDNIVENTTSAESQIRDTDMATEMVKYSNANILSQAGQSMLAQANQSNQGVLSLLG